MTIRTLVRKMERDVKINGGFVVLRNWFDSFNKAQNMEDVEKYYNMIKGMIWGVYASNYINGKERTKLMDELLFRYGNKVDELEEE